jgi:hypothetical protein
MSEKFATVFLAITFEHLDLCVKDQLGSTFQHHIVSYLSIFTILFWIDLFTNISTSGMAVVYCAWVLSTVNLKQLVNRVYNSQAARHVETFLRSALYYKSFHLKLSQNNFSFTILTLRVLWPWTNNCTDLQNWNWIFVEWIKLFYFLESKGFSVLRTRSAPYYLNAYAVQNIPAITVWNISLTVIQLIQVLSDVNAKCGMAYPVVITNLKRRFSP